VSVAANIVEGCTRKSETEFLRFLEVAYGSAREVEYQTGLCARLGYLDVYHSQRCGSAKITLNRLPPPGRGS
jgi:four helix bundle protein